MNINTQMPNRELLRSLLLPLIKEWGKEAVLKVVTEIDSSDNKVAKSDDLNSHQRLVARHTSRTKAPQSRPNPVTIVEKEILSEEKRRLLINLAVSFEHKTFLPTIADVRNFLEMRGEKSSNLKHRPEAFRSVLKAVRDMSNESIAKIIDSNKYAGPSKLGPLSDAIKASSARVRPNGHVASEISENRDLDHAKSESSNSTKFQQRASSVNFSRNNRD